jgi:hypothetical protein
MENALWVAKARNCHGTVNHLEAGQFTNPKFAWHSVVLMADSYSEAMLGGVQKQSIDRVEFENTGRGGVWVRVYARHGRTKLRSEYRAERLPVPKVSSYEVDFRLVGETFKVTAETAAAARLFGVPQRSTALSERSPVTAPHPFEVSDAPWDFRGTCIRIPITVCPRMDGYFVRCSS